MPTHGTIMGRCTRNDANTESIFTVCVYNISVTSILSLLHRYCISTQLKLKMQANSQSVNNKSRIASHILLVIIQI